MCRRAGNKKNFSHFLIKGWESQRSCARRWRRRRRQTLRYMLMALAQLHGSSALSVALHLSLSTIAHVCVCAEQPRAAVDPQTFKKQKSGKGGGDGTVCGSAWKPVRTIIITRTHAHAHTHALRFHHHHIFNKCLSLCVGARALSFGHTLAVSLCLFTYELFLSVPMHACIVPVRQVDFSDLAEQAG